MKAAILFLAATLLLAACAGTQPYYKPSGEGSSAGYSEERIDDLTWRVSFKGNSATPRGKVEDYLLYRAAEIARANGADGFVLLQEEVERHVDYDVDGYTPFAPYYFGHRYYYSPFHPFGYWRRPGFHYGPGFYGPARVREIDSYTAYANVRLYRGIAPQGEGPIYRAAEVIANLEPRILRPPQ